ncbi:ankyrin repeat ph and sec7 domain containing protein [Stylonychia lemnae]|uniref:Ankyrin repeat ph and sec7 domain containing protein n=1 Tax=Stylonychia lemnae TaxID=5949 RepID=A0A077ZSM0_STYLE|nr:ankyrin repeat ph and sec7 domain containing protein [Stylonychia lemnae]|eukprot:CDW72867.1 ankyrin repeat ph and sec7 domain containing protein [Stylonychia lemnae]
MGETNKLAQTQPIQNNQVWNVKHKFILVKPENSRESTPFSYTHRRNNRDQNLIGNQHRKMKSTGSQIQFIKPGFNLKNLMREETLQSQRASSDMNNLLSPKTLQVAQSSLQQSQLTTRPQTEQFKINHPRTSRAHTRSSMDKKETMSVLTPHANEKFVQFINLPQKPQTARKLLNQHRSSQLIDFDENGDEIRIELPDRIKEDLIDKEKVQTRLLIEQFKQSENQEQFIDKYLDFQRQIERKKRFKLLQNQHQYGKIIDSENLYQDIIQTKQQEKDLKKKDKFHESKGSKKENAEQTDAKQSQVTLDNNRKFKMKEHGMKYRSLSTDEKLFEAPLLLFKSQLVPKTQDQIADDLTIESFRIKNLMKNQLEQKKKMVMTLHIDHDHVRDFQAMVQKVMLERREKFYSQIRQIEEKKDPLLLPNFLYAIKHNKLQAVFNYLKNDPALAYVADMSQRTGLHWAAKRNYCEIISLLVRFGADLNARDAEGRTPIYMAAKYDHHEAVKILLGLNADPFIKCMKKLRPEDVTEEDALKIALKKSKMFQITANWTSKQKRQVHFMNQGMEYLNRQRDEIMEDQAKNSFHRKMSMFKNGQTGSADISQDIIQGTPVLKQSEPESPKFGNKVLKNFLHRRNTLKRQATQMTIEQFAS